MATYSPDVIEKYRAALKKNPQSQVFAPLADAYRELEQLDLAEKICKEGLKHNPDFAGGWVVLGKVQKDKKNLDQAISALQQATQLSGDNILAHILLGEVFLEKRDAAAAIKAFKMVLFFNPQHVKVKKILEKIESMSAKDYGDDVFQFKKLNPVDESKNSYQPESSLINIDPKGLESKSSNLHTRSLLRVISLLDAFIARNELKKAQEFLDEVKKEFPDEKEILYREKILRSKNQFSFLSSENRIQPIEEKAIDSQKKKVIQQKQLEVLNSLLQVIEEKKNAFF